MTSIEVGSLVWHRQVGTTAGERFGGMVVDTGLHDDGSPYFVILREVPVSEVRINVYYKGAQTPRTPTPARLDRIDLADVDPEAVTEPDVTRMEGWAKKALWGECALPGEAFALVVASGTLRQAARDLSDAQHDARAERVADFNEALAKRKAEKAS